MVRRLGRQLARREPASGARDWRDLWTAWTVEDAVWNDDWSDYSNWSGDWTDTSRDDDTF